MIFTGVMWIQSLEEPLKAPECNTNPNAENSQYKN